MAAMFSLIIFLAVFSFTSFSEAVTSVFSPTVNITQPAQQLYLVRVLQHNRMYLDNINFESRSSHVSPAAPPASVRFPPRASPRPDHVGEDDDEATISSPPPTPETNMTKRTGFATSTSGLTYRGLVENMTIPAELHERPDGKPYASYGSTVPIHCCTPEQVEKLSKTTHYYCDIFTEELLAPLGELVYVRIDENHAEKVFINRTKRILLHSSDGTLAQWRFAPTFESTNEYMAGTPIVNQNGDLVSVVTAKKGNHYAVSNFEGEGGYFGTTEPWEIHTIPEGASVYGDKTFDTRDELRDYVASLPPIGAGPHGSPTPILYVGETPRIALVAKNGRQISHQYIYGVITSEIEYL